MRRLAVFVAMVVFVACRDAVDDIPNISGRWSGTVSSSAYGNGSLAMTLINLILLPPGNGEFRQVEGQWSITFAIPSSPLETGQANAILSGPSFSLSLMPDSGATCSRTVKAALDGAGAMSGTYTSVGCGVTENGTFSATRK